MNNIIGCLISGLIFIALGFVSKKALKKLNYKNPYARVWGVWWSLFIFGTVIIMAAIIMFILTVTGNSHLSIRFI